MLNALGLGVNDQGIAGQVDGGTNGPVLGSRVTLLDQDLGLGDGAVEQELAADRAVSGVVEQRRGGGFLRLRRGGRDQGNENKNEQAGPHGFHQDSSWAAVFRVPFQTSELSEIAEAVGGSPSPVL